MVSPRLEGHAPAGNRGLAGMNGFDRQRLFSALLLLAMALFVSAGAPFAARWRRQIRFAAIAGFCIALAMALGEIAVWLIARGQ